MIPSSAKTSLAKEFTLNAQTQGALALAQNVANNPMLKLAKSAGIAQFRDFGLRKDVYTSH